MFNLHCLQRLARILAVEHDVATRPGVVLDIEVLVGGGIGVPGLPRGAAISMLVAHMEGEPGVRPCQVALGLDAKV